MDEKRPEWTNTDPIDFFTPSDSAVVRCLKLATGRSSKSAANAVIHLRRAWILRNIDQPMAALRAITAEEEAATAVLIHFRERKYRGAEKLDFHRHYVKQAVFPFSAEVLQALSPIMEHTNPRLVAKKDGHGERLDVIYTIAGQEFTSSPPLGVMTHFDPVDDLSAQEVLEMNLRMTKTSIHIDEDAASRWLTPTQFAESSTNLAKLLCKRLKARSSAAGFREFRDQVRKSAEARNSALYAGSHGWPTGISDVDQVLRARKNRTFFILRLYCLLFPYKEKSLILEQAVPALAAVLSSLEPDFRA